MNIDYAQLEEEIENGVFRTRLEKELTAGFVAIRESGERLPTASHYASQIAEIVSRGAPAPLNPELAFHLYQEILQACEDARSAALAQAEN